MTTRLIVANGCSCTRGEELIDPGRDAWPAVLSRRMGVEHVNLARDGSSNRRIVRSTVARLQTVLHEQGAEPADVLVIIAWTQVSRHEYFSEIEAPERRSGPGDGPVDRHWQRIGPWRRDAGHRPSKAFYKYLWDPNGQLINFFTDWILLDSFLQQVGVTARYAHTFPLVESLHSEPSTLAGYLNPESIWGGIPPVLGHSFLEMPSKMPRGPGGHPLCDGHQWFAGRLEEWLRGRGM